MKKDIVDLKSTMNQFVCVMCFFIQQLYRLTEQKGLLYLDAHTSNDLLIWVLCPSLTGHRHFLEDRIHGESTL